MNMEKNYRFSHQENQYGGDCLPCTHEVFNKYVDAPYVARKITTRRMVDKAIAEGQLLDVFAEDNNFKRFCAMKMKKEKGFEGLTLQQQLTQWTNTLKSSLPCFIFGTKDFGLVAKEKDGNPVLDQNGQQVYYHRRKLENIEVLSGLFMFDADHLTCDPFELYERTLVSGFPWEVRLAHKTSSGHGLRLVCEARPGLGNLADNQICLARELGLMGMKGSTGKAVVDDSCIDATRVSYTPMREDIYFIDEEHLFNI